jgi:predicted anti-sigma-YlaC factor YlaD
MSLEGVPLPLPGSASAEPAAHEIRVIPAFLARLSFALIAALLVLSVTGCSIKRFAVNSVANSLTSGPDVFASDEDPELVRDALPFGLKLMESLLAMVPDHRGLLLTCCRGYTQYAYAFIAMEADSIESFDRPRALQLRERALKMFLRARGFGLRGLELRQKGVSQRLLMDPDRAVAKLGAKDVPLLYWTAAAWGSAINVAKDRPEITADVNSVRALMDRALVLDEDWESGAIHEALITLDALPEMMGGSLERARRHFDRAVELSGGNRPSPFVLWAENVSIQAQDRAEFKRLLSRALEIDPEKKPESRLEALLTQRRARILLAKADDLFLDADTTQVEESR